MPTITELNYDHGAEQENMWEEFRRSFLPIISFIVRYKNSFIKQAQKFVLGNQIIALTSLERIIPNSEKIANL